MPESLRNPIEVLVAVARLYGELALSAASLLPSRPQPVRVPVEPSVVRRLADAPAR